MFKRTIISILTIVMAGTLLTGCTFFTHNNERDYRQVVATVESYDIVNSVRDENDETHSVTFTTEKKDIYKLDLIEYVNNNSSTLSQQYSDAESLYKAAVDMLVNTEIVINEVDALIDAGLIEWGLTETNAVKQRIYSAIDSSIMTIKNNILDEHGEEGITTDADEEVSTDTTYPTKPEQEEDEDDVRDTEEWQPDEARNPYRGSTNTDLSLGKEALTRFVNLLNERVEDDFRATEDDKKKFDEDNANIKTTIETKGYEYVYPMLGSTHLIWFISGETIERSEKIQALQSYLTDSVTVSDEEVQQSYTDTLTSQKSEYADVSKFDTAMSGSSTVLYYPNNNYFYVKHILLPFSDEQTAHLTEYKKTHGTDDVEKERDRLAESIVCYPHVAGEDDKSRPMTVAQVYDRVKSVMGKLAGNLQAADLAFDDLIYDYNTDPGAFDNNKGYVVKYKLGDGESETYMQEFADGARYMYDNQYVGQVCDHLVVTDYGVHIMYFASTTRVGEVGINSYTTPGKLETYYDVLEEPIRTARENNEYTKWENRVLNANYKTHATLYEKRYKNLWED